MDGLSIRTGIATPQVGTENTSQISIPDIGGTSGQKGSSFADTLKQAIDNVNELQKTSDLKTQALVTGKENNIHEVMLASEKADIALKLMVQVRNKMIDAYQEIMKMQV